MSFCSDPRPEDALVEMIGEKPDYDRLPAGDAVFHSPRNVAYMHEGVRYLDYHGQGVAEHDPKRDGFRVRSDNPDLLYEAVISTCCRAAVRRSTRRECTACMH